MLRHLSEMAVGLPLVPDPDFVTLLLGDLEDLLQQAPHIQQFTSSKLDLDNLFSCPILFQYYLYGFTSNIRVSWTFPYILPSFLIRIRVIWQNIRKSVYIFERSVRDPIRLI